MPKDYNRQWHILSPEDGDEEYYVTLDEFLGHAPNWIEPDVVQARSLLEIEKRRLDATDWRNRKSIRSLQRYIARLERAIADFEQI